MKKILETFVYVFGYPVAVPLIWINLTTRDDLPIGGKIGWGFGALLWPFSIAYIFTGGELW